MNNFINFVFTLREKIVEFDPYKSLPKYLRDVDSVETKKIIFELDKCLELIPDQPKIPNYVAASLSNSILHQLTHLRAQGIYPKWWSPRLGHGAVLAASKPLKYPSNI